MPHMKNGNNSQEVKDLKIETLERELSVHEQREKEDRLLQYCIDGDRGRLITELLQLFKEDKDKENPVQIQIIQT